MRLKKENKEDLLIYLSLRKKGLTTYEIYQLMIGYNMISEVLEKHGMLDVLTNLFHEGEQHDNTNQPRHTLKKKANTENDSRIIIYRQRKSNSLFTFMGRKENAYHTTIWWTAIATKWKRLLIKFHFHGQFIILI